MGASDRVCVSDVNQPTINSIRTGERIFFENQKKSDQAIREQVGQQKTRYRVNGRNRAIGEKVIGGKERSVSESFRASDRGAMGWGVSYWGTIKFGRK